MSAENSSSTRTEPTFGGNKPVFGDRAFRQWRMVYTHLIMAGIWIVTDVLWKGRPYQHLHLFRVDVGRLTLIPLLHSNLVKKLGRGWRELYDKDDRIIQCISWQGPPVNTEDQSVSSYHSSPSLSLSFPCPELNRDEMKSTLCPLQKTPSASSNSYISCLALEYLRTKCEY